MSGGSHDYICFTIENVLVDRMLDYELNDMVKDFAELCKALEWYCSADTSEEDYRKEVKKFKNKWFNSDRNTRLEKIINSRCDELKNELLKMI